MTPQRPDSDGSGFLDGRPPRPPDGRAAGPPTAAVKRRIEGVDAARALAVFGMLTVHLGVGSLGLFGLLGDDAADAFHGLTRGRSSALFAFLAGLSLALMTGRGTPLRGAAARRSMARIIVRAVVLAFLGGVLELLGAPIAVILTYYGGFFLLALPLLRLGAPALAGVAAAVALIGPQLSFAIRSAMGDDGLHESSIGGIADLLLTGYYPAATFMAFVVAGMAVGRLDLRSVRVRLGMGATGVLLALAGYGGSWLLLYPLGFRDRIAADMAVIPGDVPQAVLEPLAAWVQEQLGDMHGQVPTESPYWLLVASPHSGTTFEALGAIGTSLIVLTVCMVAMEWLRIPMYPLAAAGSMALTVYVGHIVVIAAEGMSSLDIAPFRWEVFVGTALVLCTLWRLLIGRGPLERLLGSMADAGASLVPDAVTPERAPGRGATGPGAGRG